MLVLHTHSKKVLILYVYQFPYVQAHSGMFVIILKDSTSRIVSHKPVGTVSLYETINTIDHSHKL